MTNTVCLFANTIEYPEGGGHLWVYLNWALGLRALGCEVIWLEGVEPRTPESELRANLLALKNHLEPYGLAQQVALCSWGRASLSNAAALGCLDLAAAVEADLLLNLGYALPARTVKHFRRSALVDIDPGRLQVWMSTGGIKVARHDVYYTIGETVGQPGARFPDAGLTWHYTPPCVALDWWPTHAAAPEAAFSTVSQWYTADEWMEDEAGVYANDKRDGFLPYLDLPRHTAESLELALGLSPDEDDDRRALQQRGWRVVDSTVVASTPWDYQRYIQGSRGEFSCVKPSCVRLRNAWISDRTLCYLASGKPAVVEHTGPSRFLPDAAGLFRFRTIEEAAHCLEAVAAEYERQCCLARALAEEYFDAPKVVGRVLERALG
jgi:hypothetical protein